MTGLEKRKTEILRVLQDCRGNRLMAAEKLGMDHRALDRLIAADSQLRGFKYVQSFKTKEEEKAEMSKEIQVRDEQRMQETFNTKSVVMKLETLMEKVTATDCTTDTVNAACNCAARITEILKLHLDVERLKMRRH